MIIDGSIPNGEYNNEIDDEEQEDSYVNMEPGLPRKDIDR